MRLGNFVDVAEAARAVLFPEFRALGTSNGTIGAFKDAFNALVGSVINPINVMSKTPVQAIDTLAKFIVLAVAIIFQSVLYFGEYYVTSKFSGNNKSNQRSINTSNTNRSIMGAITNTTKTKVNAIQKMIESTMNRQYQHQLNLNYTRQMQTLSSTAGQFVAYNMARRSNIQSRPPQLLLPNAYNNGVRNNIQTGRLRLRRYRNNNNNMMNAANALMSLRG